jgi:hypothetical protein
MKIREGRQGREEASTLPKRLRISRNPREFGYKTLP